MARVDARVAAACVLLASASTHAMAEGSLRAPPGYSIAAQSKLTKTAPCPPAPAAFTGTLDFPSKYEGSGESRDQLNAEADARYRLSIQAITGMEKGFAKRVGHYLQNGDLCAVSWIDGWAVAHALEGNAINHTGRSLRKWALGSLSGAWVKLKFSSSAPLTRYPAEAARVDAWLAGIAERVALEWPPSDPLEKINNHYYWAAWSLMATAVATNRRDLFDKSLALYRVFERQVDPMGYLPNEMARGSHAADYHNYAFLPLAMIAAFAKANGVDLAPESDHALERLEVRAQQALEDPASFEPLAGARQEAPDAASKSNWAWLEPYCWTVPCTPALLARRTSMRPLGSTRLGGALSSVFPEQPAP